MKIENAINQGCFSSVYHKLLLNLMYTYGWINNLNSKRLRKFGLTPQQYNILRILKGQHPTAISVKLITDRMLDPMSNVSRLVDKLVEKELVSRESCQSDRRAVNIVITDKGLHLLEELKPSDLELEAHLHTLSESEAEQLNHLLDKLRE